MPKKRKIIKDVKIESIGYGGVGIATLENGKKAIIKGGALPNSVVDIFLTRNKKDYVQGHITKVKSYDKNYADGNVFCDHYFSHLNRTGHLSESRDLIEDSGDGLGNYPLVGSELKTHKTGCGGCKRQVMSYTKQLELKEKIILENFQRILKKQSVEVHPIVASPMEKGYRNKIEFSFGKFITGKQEEKTVLSNWSLGFHKQGEFSKIVDIDRCGLISEKANKVFAYIKKLLKESGLPVHDQKTHKGVFRHLAMREGVNTEQLLVNLVIANQQISTDEEKNIREALQKTFQKDKFLQKEVTCFFVTQNNGLADVVRGPEIETEVLWGDGYIFEKLILASNCEEEGNEKVGISEKSESTFRISPFSFFQTNTYGAQKLFAHAAELIGKIKGNILDLYCGTGTIGLSFLNMGIGKELIGIDIVEAAIEDAQKNAEINKLKDKSFFVAGPAEKIIYELPQIEEKIADLDLVIVDPPREGIHKKVVSFLQDLKKQKNFKLLYISCNPVTMSRDIEMLSEDGVFKLIKLQAVDMFPQTHHIECIGVLS